MSYWLCITTADNWEVIKKHKVWGVSKRYEKTISQVKPGDVLIFYVMQTKEKDKVLPPRIVGKAKVSSEVFRDSTKIFKGYGKEQTFPLRVKLTDLKEFQKPINFKELVPKLEFIKNKKYWTGYLRRAMVKLDENDVEVVMSE
ncbi:EVE domain-containing protein [Archaeoglobales archaeon]|nr:MAG: EVE domain-containing protein [Archaeoglobales archaeon]